MKSEEVGLRALMDEEGRRWDVVVGRESWGSLFAVFVPRAGSDAVARQSLLNARSSEEAERELAALDDGALLRLLESSEPKDGGES